MPDGPRCFSFYHIHNPLAARGFTGKAKPSFRENAGRRFCSCKDTMNREIRKQEQKEPLSHFTLCCTRPYSHLAPTSGTE
jgi:hypothetical protein